MFCTCRILPEGQQFDGNFPLRIHVYILHTYICVYMCSLIWVGIYIYAYACVRVSVCFCVRICVSIYMHTLTYTNICTFSSTSLQPPLANLIWTKKQTVLHLYCLSTLAGLLNRYVYAFVCACVRECVCTYILPVHVGGTVKQVRVCTWGCMRVFVCMYILPVYVGGIVKQALASICVCVRVCMRVHVRLAFPRRRDCHRRTCVYLCVRACMCVRAFVLIYVLPTYVGGTVKQVRVCM